jgi:oligopeptide transport system substrate-binding protein
MKKFKTIIALLIVAAIALTAAACGDQLELPTSDVSEPYVYAMSQDYTTLNYLITNKQVDIDDGVAHWLQPLIMHDKFATMQPCAATEWTVSDDGLTWTVKLRDDIMWVRQDGSDYGLLKAQDYVTAAEYVLNPDNVSLYVDLMANFVAGAREYYEDNSLGMDTVGIKAVDDLTLEYTMIEPTPWFPSLLTFSVYLPVPAEWLEEVGYENFATSPETLLYNGDYILAQWDRDVERTMVKNPKGIFADRIHVPYIKFFSVPDDVLYIDLYLRGEITAAGMSTAKLLEVMEDPVLSDALYVSRLGSAGWWYSYNFRSPNENFVTAALNKNFRAAMHYAWDKMPMFLIRNPYSQEFNAGAIVPPEIVMSPEGKDYNSYGDLPQWIEENRAPYDPEKAVEHMKAAVEELGDTVTWPVTVRILGQANPNSERLNAAFMQNYHEVLGEWVQIEVVMYAAADFYDTMMEGDWDYADSGWSADYADPATYLDELRPVDGYYDQLYGFNKVPEMHEFAEMYAEAKAITDDIDARYEAMAAAESFLFEQYLFNPYLHDGGTYALNNIQNPYESTRALYGLSNTKMLDRIYGTKPLDSESRLQMRADWEAERAARSGN